MKAKPAGLRPAKHALPGVEATDAHIELPGQAGTVPTGRQSQAAASALGQLNEPLYREIRAVLEAARAGAYRAVNAAMVQAYWNVGRLIVEHEQGGDKRAAYGEAVLQNVSRRLMAEFGRGFTATNLKYMRLFYISFPIGHALRDELDHQQIIACLGTLCRDT